MIFDGIQMYWYMAPPPYHGSLTVNIIHSLQVVMCGYVCFKGMTLYV